MLGYETSGLSQLSSFPPSDKLNDHLAMTKINSLLQISNDIELFGMTKMLKLLSTLVLETGKFQESPL